MAPTRKRKLKPRPEVVASCLRCGRRLRLTLAWPVVWQLWKLPNSSQVMDVECADPDCGGNVRVMMGDLHRSAA